MAEGAVHGVLGPVRLRGATGQSGQNGQTGQNWSKWSSWSEVVAEGAVHGVLGPVRLPGRAERLVKVANMVKAVKTGPRRCPTQAEPARCNWSKWSKLVKMVRSPRRTRAGSPARAARNNGKTRPFRRDKRCVSTGIPTGFGRAKRPFRPERKKRLRPRPKPPDSTANKAPARFDAGNRPF